MCRKPNKTRQSLTVAPSATVGTASYIMLRKGGPVTAELQEAAKVLAAYLQEAIDQAKLGYEFSPNSYSYSALSSCLAAEAALGVLADSLSIFEAEHD
jgi:hypothetical protein